MYVICSRRVKFHISDDWYVFISNDMLPHVPRYERREAYQRQVLWSLMSILNEATVMALVTT